MAGLKSVFSIERIVDVRGRMSKETSYYISSLDASPHRLMAIAREHWKIKSMHWLLDVTFSEDDCRFLEKIRIKRSIHCVNTPSLFINSFSLSRVKKQRLKRVCLPVCLTAT